jgi:excisionase family DNA binding protein
MAGLIAWPTPTSRDLHGPVRHRPVRRLHSLYLFQISRNLLEVPGPWTSILPRAARVEPDAAELRQIAVVAEAMHNTAEPGSRLVMQTASGRDIALPDSIVRFVAATVDDLAAGHTVLALPAETTLTPAEAAQLLGYSRPFIARLLDEGEIPAEHLPGSTHRAVRLADVLEFQARRERNAKGRRRMAEIVEQYDLPY